MVDNFPLPFQRISENVSHRGFDTLPVPESAGAQRRPSKFGGYGDEAVCILSSWHFSVLRKFRLSRYLPPQHSTGHASGGGLESLNVAPICRDRKALMYNLE